MKILAANFGLKGPIPDPKLGLFCHFFMFDSLVLFEITYQDSSQQCLKCSRRTTHAKHFGGPNFGQNVLISSLVL